MGSMCESVGARLGFGSSLTFSGVLTAPSRSRMPRRRIARRSSRSRRWMSPSTASTSRSTTRSTTSATGLLVLLFAASSRSRSSQSYVLSRHLSLSLSAPSLTCLLSRTARGADRLGVQVGRQGRLRALLQVCWRLWSGFRPSCLPSRHLLHLASLLLCSLRGHLHWRHQGWTPGRMDPLRRRRGGASPW